MLSCRDATRLMSEGLDRPLGAAERFTLLMHVAMCRACRNTREQFAVLRRIARAYAARPEGGRGAGRNGP